MLSNLDSNEVEQLLMKLHDRINKNSIFDQLIDPYLPSDLTFISTCGVSKSQIIELHSCISSMYNTASRSKSQALDVYKKLYFSAYFICCTQWNSQKLIY